MAVSRPYHEQIDIRNTKKLRELEATLPQFLFYFFVSVLRLCKSTYIMESKRSDALCRQIWDEKSVN